MTERIRVLCSHLHKTEIFADVGCDHGYCSQYMLKNGLCETAYISDISKGSLSKAEKLLVGEILVGKCIPVVCDGMKGLPKNCSLVLIAGLGGEEIVRILSEGYLPPRFVLQPMKNAERVRAFLVERGCRITDDYTFSSEGKFYDLIAGSNAGGSVYSDWELAFGRDNLKNLPRAFLEKIKTEEEKLRAYLNCDKMSGESRDALRRRLYDMEVITDAVEGDL